MLKRANNWSCTLVQGSLTQTRRDKGKCISCSWFFITQTVHSDS